MLNDISRPFSLLLIIALAWYHLLGLRRPAVSLYRLHCECVAFFLAYSTLFDKISIVMDPMGLVLIA